MRNYEVTARNLRLKIAEMVYRAGEGHIPSSFSVVDIIYASYLSLKLISESCKVKGRFVLSKGHAAAALFVVLAEFGVMDEKYLAEYGQDGGILAGHPDRNKQVGVEANTGSLGHGLPYAVGLALGSRLREESEFIICLVGDGECQEGTTWEAAAIAANQHLENLVVIIDWNGSAAQLQSIENLEQKWKSFGFNVVNIDGHNIFELHGILTSLTKGLNQESLPTALIAKTVKGKGVSFMEGHGKWHHRIPTEQEMFEIRKHLSV